MLFFFEKLCYFFFIFFFSSRRRHTRLQGDWSSDVCSSDLRVAALRAGLPVTSSGETVNRFCSSGLMAISIAAQRVIVDRVPVAVAGGVESISLVQNNLNKHHIYDENWI